MSRLKVYLLAPIMVLTLIMSSLPVDICVSDTGNLNINGNTAHANPVVAPALEFLSECAAATGLSSSQFVATVAGVSTVATGTAWAKDQGINLGASLGHNLDALLEAADYPDYNTLDTETQEAWGSKQNYDAAKLNSLMDAFDLGDARERFYSSGGGNFEWQDGEREGLQRLQRIGSNWLLGAANNVSDILASLNSETYMNVYEGYLGVSNYKEIKREDYPGWPSNAPEKLYVGKGNANRLICKKSTSRLYNVFETSDDVYWIGYYISGSAFGVETFNYDGYSAMTGTKSVNDSSYKPELNYWPSASSTSNATSITNSGYSFYSWGRQTNTAFQSIEETTLPFNQLESNQVSFLKTIEALILQGQELNIGVMPESINGYPENVQSEPEQPVYYPDDGITPKTTWSQLTTEPTGGGSGGGETGKDYTSLLQRIIELLEQFKYYADGTLKVHDHAVLTAINELNNEIAGMGTNVDLSKLERYVSEGFQAVDDDISGIRDDLSRIIAILSTPDVHDVVGDFDYDALLGNADALRERLATLAPFGAAALMAAMLAIWSGSGVLQTPKFDVPFNFAVNDNIVNIDLSWLEGVKPVIDFFMISMLIFCLVNASMRIIELEAAK